MKFIKLLVQVLYEQLLHGVFPYKTDILECTARNHPMGLGHWCELLASGESTPLSSHLCFGFCLSDVSDDNNTIN